jgi:SAM-dependent methyltransferase
VGFAVPAEAYDRFMGRYAVPLSPLLADVAGIEAGPRDVRVLDVGCGPGALTAELVARLGSASVSAVDPSAPFVAAARERNPDVEVQQASAEDLPYPSDSFDAALAQLVVQFMTDPPRGVDEMKRVTRPGGVVVACVWDHGGGNGPLSPLWDAARELDPDVTGEARQMGTREGDLATLFASVGLREVEETALPVSVEHPTFEEWWEPFTLGVGPAGAYVARLDDDDRTRLRERLRAVLPPAPFTLPARAWAARGTV